MPTEPTEPQPTEPNPAPGADAGLGLDLFGDPITAESVAAARARDEEPGQNQDGGLTMNADEWEIMEEVWSDEAVAARNKARRAAQEKAKETP